MTPAPHPHVDCLMKEHWGELRQWKVNSEQREESLEKKLDLILLQTQKTNGRVMALEKWRIGMMAGLGVLALVSGPEAVARIAKVITVAVAGQ